MTSLQMKGLKIDDFKSTCQKRRMNRFNIFRCSSVVKANANKEGLRFYVDDGVMCLWLT